MLLGETGAGKTTTLRLVAGLEKPTSGQVFIDGVDVADWGAAERDVAMVLQQYSLYPRYTVRENLEFPLKSKLRRVPDAEIAERVARVAATLRIEHLLDRKTDRLSGGEMQRVSIGRAIVRKPRVFLMDEPLSALDAKLREALRTELKNIQMNLGQTFLFVTHDQIEAMSMGDKIGVLNHGRLVQTGTPNEIYNNPRDTFVASFVGSPPMNLVDGRLVSGRAVMAPMNFELPYGGPSAANADGRPLVFGIRPEDLYLESGAPVEARVHDVENHGVEKILTLRVGDVMLRATVPAQHRRRHRAAGALRLEPGQGGAVRQGHRRQPAARGVSDASLEARSRRTRDLSEAGASLKSPPLIAVSTNTSVPGSIRVSRRARSPSMKMLMWRRTAGVELQSRSRMPGQRASSSRIISSTVAADISTERSEPGNRSTRTPGSLTVTAFAPVVRCGLRFACHRRSALDDQRLDRRDRRQMLGDRRPAVALVGAGEERAGAGAEIDAGRLQPVGRHRLPAARRR